MIFLYGSKKFVVRQEKSPVSNQPGNRDHFPKGRTNIVNKSNYHQYGQSEKMESGRFSCNTMKNGR